MEPVRVHEFVWHAATLRKIRRHGGSVRVCKEVRDGEPRFLPQSGRAGTHRMIGPDRRGRIWVIVIRYLGGGLAEPITAWPAKGRQIDDYTQAIDETN
jgi:hypothetical protein